MNTNDERSVRAGGALPGTLPMQMRGPAEMAEMLPYLLGFFPDDSIVAVGLQGPSLHQGGVIRLDIPADRESWPQVAQDAADLLVDLSEKRDRRPRQVLLYLVRDSVDPARAPSDPAGGPPGPGRGPQPADAVPVAELRPLADALAAAFERADVGVKESLCVSGGRWWSFLCKRPSCCDPAGTPVRPVDLPSPIAAAAAFAGLAPRGSRKAIVAGLAPIGPPVCDIQRQEIERAGPGFLRELSGGRLGAVDRTGDLLTEALAAFRGGANELDPQVTARLLLGLQDKLGRDRGAEFAEPDELGHAQRLWRFLAQRCVSPFDHLAPPPLTLLAWTAWLAGDIATARIVLSRALAIDADYTLAQLLYESINAGLAPERLLESVREQRVRRAGRLSLKRPAARATEGEPGGASGAAPAGEPETGPGPRPGRGPQAAPGAGGVVRAEPAAEGGADPGFAPGCGPGRTLPLPSTAPGSAGRGAHRGVPPAAEGCATEAALPSPPCRPGSPVSLPPPVRPPGRTGRRWQRPSGASGRPTRPGRAFRPLRG
ncbi:DUF4192 family protein [Kitasatospora sp. NPDC059571]|uniref:DUF4192 domain-containing protein n=1 Tax=Kitasatospora sp. NPDC059571 TaxID=3346871 RepID=UPI00369BD833